MKITIEINDEELKGLIFGDEKKKCISETGYKMRFSDDKEARYILNTLIDYAEKHRYSSVADYKSMVDDMVSRLDLLDETKYIDVKYGWDAEDLRKGARIVRESFKIWRLEMPKEHVI